MTLAVPALAQNAPAGPSGSAATAANSILLLQIAVLILIFLPLLIAMSRGRGWLIAGTIAFCLMALGGFFLSAVTGLGAAIILPGVGLVWMAALFCGLAAFLDSAAERRSKEFCYRLLTNDARGMDVPTSVRVAARRERTREGWRRWWSKFGYYSTKQE
jgi:hypothetical protein